MLNKTAKNDLLPGALMTLGGTGVGALGGLLYSLSSVQKNHPDPKMNEVMRKRRLMQNMIAGAGIGGGVGLGSALAYSAVNGIEDKISPIDLLGDTGIGGVAGYGAGTLLRAIPFMKAVPAVRTVTTIGGALIPTAKYVFGQ